MPATKNTASPGFDAGALDDQLCRTSSGRYFASGPFGVLAVHDVGQAAKAERLPPAPTVLSKKLRDRSAAPGAGIARTTPPVGHRLREHRERPIRGRARRRRRPGSDCAGPACRCRTSPSRRRTGCAGNGGGGHRPVRELAKHARPAPARWPRTRRPASTNDISTSSW